MQSFPLPNQEHNGYDYLVCFNILKEQTFRSVYTVCLRLVKKELIARKIAENVFKKALIQKIDLENISLARIKLHSMAANMALDHITMEKVIRSFQAQAV